MPQGSLQSWQKKPVSMRLRQDTIDLLDALIGHRRGDGHYGTIQNRTDGVEMAVVALAAALKVKTAGLKKPAGRRR